MAVDYDTAHSATIPPYSNSFITSGSPSSIPFSVGSNPDRLLVVAVTWSSGGSSLVSATWTPSGGAAETFTVIGNGTSTGFAILKNPTPGVGGVVAVAVNANSKWTINLWSLFNVDQAIDATWFTMANGSALTTQQATASSKAAAVGDLILDCEGRRGNASELAVTSPVANLTQTERTESFTTGGSASANTDASTSTAPPTAALAANVAKTGWSWATSSSVSLGLAHIPQAAVAAKAPPPRPTVVRLPLLVR